MLQPVYNCTVYLFILRLWLARKGSLFRDACALFSWLSFLWLVSIFCFVTNFLLGIICNALENWLAGGCNWVQMQFPFSPHCFWVASLFWVVSDCLENSFPSCCLAFSHSNWFLAQLTVIDFKTVVGSTERAPTVSHWTHSFNTHLNMPNSHSWKR